MAGQLLLRCRSCPSSSPGFRLGLPTFYRVFSASSAASTRRINLKTDYSSKLAEAECSEHWKVFKSWMSKYKKRYRSDKEMLYRFEIFTQCLKDVEELNKENSGCTYGLNHRSDLTYEECRPRGKLTLSELAEVVEVTTSEHWEAFDSWMWKHKKKYLSNKEMFHRFKIFKECLKNIEKANEENPGCTFGFNRYSDLTSEELPSGRSSFSKLPSGRVCLSKLLPTVPFSMRKGEDDPEEQKLLKYIYEKWARMSLNNKIY